MSRARLFSAACAAMFVFGVVLAILGALFGIPEIRSRMGIDLAEQGDIFLIEFLGIFVSTLIAGPIIDSYGKKVVLTASAACVAAGLLGLLLAQSFLVAMVTAFVTGFGGGGLNTSANALVADLYDDRRGVMLNRLGVFFGLGAMIVPLLVGNLDARLSLYIVASLAMLSALAYAALPFPPPGEKIGFSLFASIRAARTPGVLLIALLLFFESGNEASIGGWTSTYVGSIGAAPRVATLVLTGYWAALMIGRLLGARLLASLSPARLVLASGIGSAIGSTILLVSQTTSIIAAGAVLTGLSFAAIYPTMLAVAADRYQRVAGTIFGFLFAAGLIGGMLFPFGIGHLSQHFGVRAGMALPLIGAIAISILIMMIGKR